MASRWFKDLFDIRPGERALAGLMFVYFFLVITSFWILKPIKKSIDRRRGGVGRAGARIASSPPSPRLGWRRSSG